MPWEVGYFDALDQGEIGIVPVLDNPEEEFEGMEFLGLYNVVDVRSTRDGGTALYIETARGDAVRLKHLLGSWSWRRQ
jgi:hypothetical protein